MKLLVTGGAGFIGSNLVHYLLRKHPEDEIVILDALTYAGHLENLRDVRDNPRLKFIKGDICDPKVVKEAMVGVDAVYHLAAETHVDKSITLEGAINFAKTNLIGTYVILYSAKEAGVKRTLIVSTDEVYGDLDFEDPIKFHEDYGYNPHSPYAVSKTAQELAGLAFWHTWHKEGDMEILITNCTNNYGSYQTPEKMLPRSIFLLLNGDKLKLYTDENGIPGKNVRDWLYVDDHCEALDLVMQKGKAGETYCIGGNSELSNYQLVEKILAVISEATNKPMCMETHVEFVQDRPGHDRRYAMDTSKIERELGWKRKYTFEEGFKKTMNWYTSGEGREWLQHLKETAKEVREGQDRSIERK